jgi:hypothetical protein
MSKFGSFEYHAGNLVFFLGVSLILVNIILILIFVSTSPGVITIYLIIVSLGFIVGIICIIIGLHYIKIDKQKSEHGIVIGLKEQHETKIKAKGNNVILLVDNIPKLNFEAKYFNKKTVKTTIGNLEKHGITVVAQASAWSGEIDKFVYVDNVLALKDERPIW